MNVDKDLNEPWFPLEAELQADAVGSRRDAVVAELQELSDASKRRIDQGLAPDAYRRETRIKVGLDAAIGVVRLIWYRYHGAGTSR
jgi:hypothetical protein